MFAKYYRCICLNRWIQESVCTVRDFLTLAQNKPVFCPIFYLVTHLQLRLFTGFTDLDPASELGPDPDPVFVNGPDPHPTFFSNELNLGLLLRVCQVFFNKNPIKIQTKILLFK